jgi:hypothetical protein
LANISIQILAILASWHVWAKYDNLLLASWCIIINSPKLNELIERDSLACSDKIVPKHKFLFKLSLVFLLRMPLQFLWKHIKVCAIVPTLVVIFLSFLIRNRKWDTYEIPL